MTGVAALAMKLVSKDLSQLIKDDFRIENNALVREVKDARADRIELEVGDTKQQEFFPQAKIKRWDNEVNFSLRWKTDDPTAPQVTTEADKIVYRKGAQAFRAYHLDAGAVGEDGGLEIDIVLDEQPDTNMFEFTLQTKGLEFLFQPDLTPEELEEGSSRPENVIASYAVYHATKANNQVGGMAYRTGKAFHIYRPKVTDAAGNETWAELAVDEEASLLTVTVPQKFLDQAVYPVVVDPTFGYTSAGGSSTTGVGAICMAGTSFIYTAGPSDMITNFHFYGSGSSASVDLAAYQIVTTPTNRLASPVTVPLTSTLQWYSASVSQALTNGVAYGVAMGNYSGTPSLRFDSGAGNNRYASGGTTLQDPWSGGTWSGSRWSIYATYSTPATDVTVPAGVLSLTSSIPAVSVTAERNVTISPVALGSIATIPTVGISIGDGATPAPIDGTFSIPAVTVAAIRNVSIAPAALGAVGSIPAVGVSVGDGVTAIPLAGVLSIPTVAVTAQRSVTVPITPLLLSVSIPSQLVGLGINVAAGVLSAVLSIPAVTVAITKGLYTRRTALFSRRGALYNRRP